MAKMLWVAASAVSLCSCAAREPSFRSVSAHAEITQGTSRGFTPVSVAADESRLVGVDRSGAIVFVASKESGGCVSLHFRAGARRYCPVTDGEQRLFHAVGGASQFGVALGVGHLDVEADFGRATLALSADPAFAPLRRHPELAAAAIAERFLPAKPRPLGVLPGKALEVLTDLRYRP